MNKWLWVIILSIQTHFAASYLVPLWEKDQGGLLKWVWPWGVGDKGFLGKIILNQMPMAGFYIAMSAASLSILAILGALGIWIPHNWWRYLAIVSAVLEVILMIGFFGITKLLPIVFNMALVFILWKNWETLKLK